MVRSKLVRAKFSEQIRIVDCKMRVFSLTSRKWILEIRDASHAMVCCMLEIR